MKDFFAVERYTSFDLVLVYYICFSAGTIHWAFILLLIPQSFLSMFLREYFLKKEEQKNNGKQ